VSRDSSVNKIICNSLEDRLSILGTTATYRLVVVPFSPLLISFQ